MRSRILIALITSLFVAPLMVVAPAQAANPCMVSAKAAADGPVKKVCVKWGYCGGSRCCKKWAHLP